MRYAWLAVLLLGCSSKPAEPIDAAIDVGGDAFLDDTFDALDDTAVDDTATASCFGFGDPCFVNADCCSNNCIGLSDSDGGVIMTTCR